MLKVQMSVDSRGEVGEFSQKENGERGSQTAQRRGYFNINHLSNILTGFKNPILSILPLSTGSDYQPPSLASAASSS